MKRNIVFATLVALATTFSLVSCGDKDNKIDYDGVELTDSNPIVILSQEHDPTAAYPLHFNITLTNGVMHIAGLVSNPSIEVNGLAKDYQCQTGTAIATVGEVKSLSKIDEVPSISKFAEASEAFAKYGYVAKVWGATNMNAWQNASIHDPDTAYLRLWIEGTSTNGFKVRYEFPWDPNAKD